MLGIWFSDESTQLYFMIFIGNYSNNIQFSHFSGYFKFYSCIKLEYLDGMSMAYTTLDLQK